MYVVRNTMYAKPGQGAALIEKFKAAAPHMEEMGPVQVRVLTDTVGEMWTVEIEMEVESLDTYFAIVDGRTSNPAMGEAMAGYAELVTRGKREILKVV